VDAIASHGVTWIRRPAGRSEPAAPPHPDPRPGSRLAFRLYYGAGDPTNEVKTMTQPIRPVPGMRRSLFEREQELM